MFQRINQWVADFFCRDVNGAEVPQVGATVTYSIYNAADTEIFTGQGVTTSYGWVSFDETSFDGYTGRVKVVATGSSESGSASSTFYRQAGVVTSAGRPAAGVAVKFAAPTAGARATISGHSTVTVTTDSRGYATSPRLKAGKTAGTYSIEVTAHGFGTATFKLKNLS